MYSREYGDSYVVDETATLGHDWDAGEVITQPTGITENLMRHTCTRCGEADSNCQKPSEPVENPLNDVPADQGYVEPLLWAVENSITSGTSATTLAPETPAPGPRTLPSCSGHLTVSELLRNLSASHWRPLGCVCSLNSRFHEERKRMALTIILALSIIKK